MPRGPEKQRVAAGLKAVLADYNGLSKPAKKSLSDKFPHAVELMKGKVFCSKNKC